MDQLITIRVIFCQSLYYLPFDPLSVRSIERNPFERFAEKAAEKLQRSCVGTWLPLYRTPLETKL